MAANLDICSMLGGVLAPGSTCYAQCNSGEDVACFFDVKGKVKASLQVHGVETELVVPATK